MSEEEAYEFVMNTLRKEAIVPLDHEEIDIVRSIEKCMNCGSCINLCPVVAAVGMDTFSGPRSIAIELSRSTPEFWTSANMIFLCTGCGTCRENCPHDVDIPMIVNLLRWVIYKQRPELIPKQLLEVQNRLEKHSLAFEPWEDIEDKNESRDVRIEQLGIPFVKDRKGVKAEVLFYPGCQAEERAQEVREAAKYILVRLEVDYCLLSEMSCCGLPARLSGAKELARDLEKKLISKIKETGAKKIVTTCAGCTSSLSEIIENSGVNVKVYHIIEYLMEEVDEAKLKLLFERGRGTSESTITIHDPCHLIRHTSRMIMYYASIILRMIPGVSIKPSSAFDSCCGGGGMVGYHSPHVASRVTEVNVKAIERTGAERVVTPCPLCTTQLENELFRSNVVVDVDDFTVFIAQQIARGER